MARENPYRIGVPKSVLFGADNDPSNTVQLPTAGPGSAKIAGGILIDTLEYACSGVGIRYRVDKKKGVPYEERAGGKGKAIFERTDQRFEGADPTDPMVRALARFAKYQLPNPHDTITPPSSTGANEPAQIHVTETPGQVAARLQSQQDGLFDATAPSPVVPLRQRGGFSDIGRNTLHVGTLGQSSNTPTQQEPALTASQVGNQNAMRTESSLARLSTRALAAILQENPDVLAEVRRQSGMSRLGTDLTTKNGMLGKSRPLSADELKNVRALIEQALNVR